MSDQLRFCTMPGDANRDATKALEKALKAQVHPDIECAYSLRSLAEGSNRVDIIVNLVDHARNRTKEIVTLRCIPDENIDSTEACWATIAALVGAIPEHPSPQKPPRP